MLELIANYGQNVLSASMIILVILGAFKWRYTWLWGLFSQVMWSIWIYASGESGFIAMNAFMYVAYSYAHYQWIKGPGFQKLADEFFKDIDRMTSKGRLPDGELSRAEVFDSNGQKLLVTVKFSKQEA